MSASFDDLFSQVENEYKSSPKQSSSNFDEIFSQVEENQPSKLRSLASAPLKGLIKGAAKFSPLPSFGPVPHDLGVRITEQLLPTRKGDTEDVLEFAGENLPAVALGEGGLAKKGLQALTGGLAKKVGKDLDLPEWAQELLGSAGMAGPDIASAFKGKSLLPAPKQKNMVEFLRSKGLSDADITPIIQDKGKLSFFSKAARKFEKRDPLIKGIQEKVGGIYEGIRESGKKAGYLEGKELVDFEKAFHDKLQKVPRMYRGLVQKEVDDLMRNPIDFTELHDFKKAINAIVGDVEGGKAAVGILKEPIEKAQSKMNPSLYSDLKKTDKAYSQLMDFTDKMTKKDIDNLISMGEAGGLLYGALTLNPKTLGLLGAKMAAKPIARKFLIEPKFQNIHRKMWNEFLKGKIPQALKLAEIIKKELKLSEESNDEEIPSFAKNQ